MKKPVPLLRSSAVCLAVLMATSAMAQGLRPSGSLSGSGLGAPRSGAGATIPSVTVPAVTRAGSSLPQQADYIVAVVNSEPITNNEVRMRTERAMQQLSQQGTATPPVGAVMRQVLERVINEKAQLQQARESGIKIDDAAVDQAEQNVARQNQIDAAEMRRRLAADGIPLARFREDLRSQLILLRLREREVESRVKVSDLEIDQFIRDQQGKNDPASLELNLAHVLILVPENASPQEVAPLQQKAQRVAERARAGDNFATLARDNSDASERTNGGLLGLRGADRYPPLFVDATKNLPVGGIVGPIRSPAGFHILKVVERVQGGVAGATVTQMHARHILLRANPQLTEARALAQLADYKRRVQTGQSDFADLAREFSKDGSAQNGGDLGWASPGQFVPEFEEVLESLAPGQVSDPVVSRFGVHLIQLLERRQHTLTQREQRDLARSAAREKKLDEAFSNWAQETRGRAYVEYREAPQ